MHTKLIYLTCFVLVLGPALTGTASAEIVGWWKLDEGSGTVANDSSRYNNDVFFNGDPQWVEGYYNSGLEFDGTDDCLDRGVYEPVLDIVDGITMTAWIKPGATLRDHEIGGNITIGPNGGGYVMGIYSNDNLEFEVRSSAGTSAPPSRPGGGTMLQTDTWYFVAGTYAQTADGGVITTYVNGELDAEMVTTIVMDPSPGTFVIGRDPNAPGAGQFIGVIDDVRVYNHILTESELRDAMLGKWPPSEIAFAPDPEDEQVDVPRDVVLGWKPGIYAQTHDVYFGSVFEDVNKADRNNPLDVLVGQNQDVNMYEAGILEFGQTYFWRIDDVNAVDSSIHRGDTWRFTTETFGYPIPAGKITATASSFQDEDSKPGSTIDGSGLVNDLHSIDTKSMWLSDTGDPGSAWIQYDFDKPYMLYEMLVWNYNGPFLLTGFSIKDVTIEHSTDGATWTVLSGANEFAQALGADGYKCNTIIDFSGILAKSVRIIANSNWGGPIFNQYGLSEVRFLYIPVHAREPNPDSGETDVNVDVTLGWRAGREAAEHDVYLSTDEQAVIDGTAPVATVTDASYSPPEPLILENTYYWRVDEVNNSETPTTWQGELWSLSIQEFLVVDDFESYNDLPAEDEGSNLVYATWTDGFNDPSTNGSTIGYVEPFQPSMETEIVHGGEQSVPFRYDNTTASYSEVSVNSVDLPIGSDWSIGSPQTLVLSFHGSSDNAPTEQMYVKVNGIKVVYPGDAADVTRSIWKQWNIDLAALGIDLSNVTQLSIGFERTGAIGSSGIVFIDDILLYRSAPAIPSEEIWIEAEAANTISEPLLILSDVPGTSDGEYITVMTGNNSTSEPPAEGVATYIFTVEGGIYKVLGRVITYNLDTGDDSCWFRIQGATTQTTNHSSGWVRWNDIELGQGWHWDVVHSSDDGNEIVEFTMAPGTYTLEFAYREDGLLLDAIVISKLD